MGDNTTQKKESLEVVSTQQVAAPKGEVIEYDRGNERFLAYFARFRQLINSMNAARRYLAYSSDVGESFRPILHPKLVTASYGLSWAYVIGECAYLTYLDRTHGEPQNVQVRTFLHSLSFQAIASMAIPAFTIHTAVAQTIKLLGRESFRNNLSPFSIKWAPSAVGLAIIPFLPLVDHPVEHGIDYLFDTFWPVQKKLHVKIH